MTTLNFQHLLYFWTVAREGTIARAGEKLSLSQSAISSQIRTLERYLQAKLFQRVGRSLVLTDIGRVVYRYADDIFSLGEELQAEIRGRPGARAARVEVGVADVLPRWIVYLLLEPAFRLSPAVQLVCYDDKTERLLSRLALNELDVVLTDVPAGPLVKVRAYNHQLGDCGISFLTSTALASKYRRRFPKSLDRAPFILPMEGSALRRTLDDWFTAEGIRPIVQCEIGDRDLFEVFAESGLGVFAAPTILEHRLKRQFSIQVIGRVSSIREQYFAISTERKIKHPAVAAITEGARDKLSG